MTDDPGRRLRGRSVLVTGSSRGIGLAVARELVAQGAAVVINGRDAGVVAAAVEELELVHAGRVAGVAGSAADPAVVDAMVVEARRRGDLSALITCAGTAEPAGSSILDIELADWEALIEAHLTSTFVACRAVAPLLVERGGGAIVTTSSHAFTGAFGGTGYAAGKGGVNSLTYALAAELREHRVRVNAVCPGARTRLSEGEEYEAGIDELHRRGLLDDLMRHGALSPAPASHVAALYAWLVGDDAREVTGEILAGAGGYLGRFARPSEELLAYRDHADMPSYTPEEVGRHVESFVRDG